MRVNDFSALSELRLRSLKVLNIRDVKKVIESEIATLNDFLTIINGYDVVKCLYDYIKLDERLSVNTIYTELCKCWINELLSIVGNASADLIKFVKTYLTKYAIYTLVDSIKYLQVGGFEKPRSVFKCLNELLNANDVSDVIEVLRSCKEFNNSILTEVLYSYINHKLDGIDLGRLEMEFNDRYWNNLISDCSKLVDSIKLRHVLLTLRDFHIFDTSFKRKSLRGEDTDELLRKYDYSIYRFVVRNLNINLYDYVSNVFKYILTTSSLKYSPLSYDVLLHYLLIKEWEAITMSYVIYSFTNNLGQTYVKNSIKALVDAYGSSR